MEKVKFEFKPVRNKTIKFSGNLVEIKPYISTQELSAIIDVCLDTFNSLDEEYNRFVMCKCVFDILVIDFCSNIKIDGVTKDQNKDNITISGNIEPKIIEMVDETNLVNSIIPYINNYKECLEQMYKILEIKNVRDTFVQFGKSIPSADDLSNSLSAAMNEVVKLKQSDPDTFNKIVKESLPKTTKKKNG